MKADFNARVYAAVKKIPRGQVATYGEIAARAGFPRYARHVGMALSALPDGARVPWQRVVNAAGRISLRVRHWERGSDDYQRVLLESEGVVFSIDGKIDLKRFGWLRNQPETQ